MHARVFLTVGCTALVGLGAWVIPISGQCPGAPARSGVSADTLLPGARLRVLVQRPEGRSPARLAGRLVGVDERGIEVGREGGEVVRIPLENVLLLERSIGRRRNTKRGALVGLGVGGVLGAAAGLGTDPYSDCGGAAGEGECAFWLYGAVLFGALGAGLGAVVGHAVQGDVWREVPLASIGRVGSPGRNARLILSWSVAVP